MGTSLVTPAQQTAWNAQFHDIHATFARPIYIFQTSKGIVIASNPDHNYLFDSAPTNDTETYLIQSGTFLARIKYDAKQPLVPFSTVSQNAASDQVGIRQSDGSTRIKLDATGAAFIAGAQRVEFDGNIFEIDTQDKPHSLLGTPEFQDFYLKSIQ